MSNTHTLRNKHLYYSFFLYNFFESVSLKDERFLQENSLMFNKDLSILWIISAFSLKMDIPRVSQDREEINKYFNRKRNVVYIHRVRERVTGTWPDALLQY